MTAIATRFLTYDREKAWRLSAFAVAWFALAWAALDVRLVLIHPNAQFDGYTLWNAWHGPMYIDTSVGPSLWYACYHWSPLAALFLWPAAQLPADAFVVLLTAAGALTYAWLLAPLPLPSRIPAIAAGTLFALNGNIEWLIAFTAVAGMRWPALWLVSLFTKVTPFLGFGWFLLKRQWHAVAVAALIAVVGAAVSFALMPSEWWEWLRLLPTLGAESARTGTYNSLMPPIPLVIRGPLSLLTLWWALRKNQPAWLGLMLLLSQPDLQPWALGYLAAVPRLMSWRPATREAPEAPLATAAQVAS